MKTYLIKTNADLIVIADDGEVARWATADYNPARENPMVYLSQTEWDFDEFEVTDDREAFLNEMLYNYDAGTTEYSTHDLNEVIAEYDDEVGLTGDYWQRDGYTITRGYNYFDLHRDTDGKLIASIVPADMDYKHDWAAIIGGADPVREGWYDGREPLPSEDVLYESDDEE